MGELHNLPAQTTSFIGRKKEMEEVKALLRTSRLLTLTGSGGCGKTRLALHLAAGLLDQFADGVWLVELAPLADPALVHQTVAQVLGINEQTGRPYSQALIESLSKKRVLLLLDNCEHVLFTSAQLSDALLRYCPDVKILATSREGFGIAGELTYRVPSLSLPELKQKPTLDNVSQYESVCLFVERAFFHMPAFAMTNQNAPAIVSVCHRLDGIPLAIELAAARVNSLSVEDINNKLDNCLRLLTGGSKTALPKQQTLLATMDWSHELLNNREKAFLARLSAFAGGWTLEAAERVCGQEGIEEWETMDLLASLVNKSLVIAEERDGSVRYRLLETVRQYANERLEASGQTQQVKVKHRYWFLALAEQAELHLKGPEQATWLKKLDAEHDNLRVALAWRGTDVDKSEIRLRIAGALARFWEVRGYISEGRQHLHHVLQEKTSDVETEARARALNGAGMLASNQSENVNAYRYINEALAIQERIGDIRGCAISYGHLCVVASRQENSDLALGMIERSLVIWRELNDEYGIATALDHLGVLKRLAGDLSGAFSVFQEGLKYAKVVGDELLTADYIGNMGFTAYLQGDYAQAEPLLEQALAIRLKLGYKKNVVISLNTLGSFALKQKDFALATTRYSESLRIKRTLADKRGITFSLDGLAKIASLKGKPKRAVQLLGAADALREEIYMARHYEKHEYDALLIETHSLLGEEAFAAAWEEGRGMTWEQAVAYALEEK